MSACRIWTKSITWTTCTPFVQWNELSTTLCNESNVLKLWKIFYRQEDERLAPDKFSCISHLRYLRVLIFRYTMVPQLHERETTILFQHVHQILQSIPNRGQCSNCVSHTRRRMVPGLFLILRWSRLLVRSQSVQGTREEDSVVLITSLCWLRIWLQFAKISWCLFALKLIDYIETVLFALRKKTRQVSFLHLYHHVTTAFFAWWIVKYSANGMSMTAILVNCSIHVIMYIYYLLSSFGSGIQRRLQIIKPMITMAQMVSNHE